MTTINKCNACRSTAKVLKLDEGMVFMYTVQCSKCGTSSKRKATAKMAIREWNDRTNEKDILKESGVTCPVCGSEDTYEVIGSLDMECGNCYLRAAKDAWDVVNKKLAAL